MVTGYESFRKSTCIELSGQQHLEALGKVVVGEPSRVSCASNPSDLEHPAAAKLVQNDPRLKDARHGSFVRLYAAHKMELCPAKQDSHFKTAQIHESKEDRS